MSKHTPGPWMVGEINGQSVEIDSHGDPTLGYAGWEGLAIVHGCEDQPHLGKEVMLANARLIAAAPDLLEALRELFVWANTNDPGTDAGEDTAPLKQARAAIAKATS